MIRTVRRVAVTFFHRKLFINMGKLARRNSTEKRETGRNVVG